MGDLDLHGLETDLDATLSAPDRYAGDARRRTASYLSDVHDLAVLALAVEQLLYATVTKARTDGVTWELIGRALNVTRSAAQQRFSKPSRGRLV